MKTIFDKFYLTIAVLIHLTAPVMNLRASPCSKCNEAVTDPICVSSQRFYPTRCHMTCLQVDDLQVAPWIMCKECDLNCPLIHNPVCGSDGEIYPNRCVLLEASCRDHGKLKEAPDEFCCNTCKTLCHDPIDSCEKACPKTYQPICGKNGHIYANDCLFGNAVCKTKGELKKASMSECCKNKPNCPNFLID